MKGTPVSCTQELGGMTEQELMGILQASPTGLRNIKNRTLEVCLRALEISNRNYMYVPKELKEELAILEVTLGKYGQGLKDIPAKYQNVTLVAHALEKDARNLRYVKTQTCSICLYAWRKGPESLKYVDTKASWFEYFWKEVLFKKPWHIELFATQEPAMQEYIVAIDPMSIRFCKHPADYLYDYALATNLNSFIVLPGEAYTIDRCLAVLAVNPDMFNCIPNELRPEVLQAVQVHNQRIKERSRNGSTDGKSH